MKTILDTDDFRRLSRAGRKAIELERRDKRMADVKEAHARKENPTPAMKSEPVTTAQLIMERRDRMAAKRLQRHNRDQAILKAKHDRRMAGMEKAKAKLDAETPVEVATILTES